MLLLIGLGNPGEKYKKNRHNAGFIMVDELRKKWNFPEFNFNKKFNAETTEGVSSSFFKKRAKEGFLKKLFYQTNRDKLIIAKPQTFMNRSGEAVRKIMDFYKLAPENIVIIYDDLDMEIGKYKISDNLSSAGHKGIQSVMDHVGTQKFKRIRIGVEKEGGRKNRGNISGEDFVLQDFEKEEIEKLKKLVDKIQFNLIF